MNQVSLVYKVDNPVQSSLSSSLVLPNTRIPLNLTLRALSYNNSNRNSISTHKLKVKIAQLHQFYIEVFTKRT